MALVPESLEDLFGLDSTILKDPYSAGNFIYRCRVDGFYDLQSVGPRLSDVMFADGDEGDSHEVIQFFESL